MTRIPALLTAVALVLLVLAPAAAALPFPDVIDLPDGFQPEGIATGRGTTFFVGSLADGAVYRGDLRTGRGQVLVPGREGAVTVGIEVDRRNRVFAAGGATGQAAVYDAGPARPSRPISWPAARRSSTTSASHGRRRTSRTP